MEGWHWALLAGVAVLVLAAALVRNPPLSTILQRAVNVVAFVAVGASVVLGVGIAQSEPDPGSCTAPDGIRAAADAADDAKAVARRELRAARTAAQGDPDDPRLERARERRDRWTRVPATVDPTTTTTFDLGNDPSPGLRSIAFTLEGRVPGPHLVQVDATPFTSAGAGREIAPDDLVTWAELDPGGRSGTVYLCVTPERRAHLPSGQLTGSLAADDVRLGQLEPEVSLTLAYPDVRRVMLVGLAIAFAASWYVFFLRRDQLEDVVLLGKVVTPTPPAAPTTEEQRDEAARVLRWPFGFWVGYWRWATSASGVITVVAGMVAAVTAFSTAYLGSETWTGSFGDWFAYCGAVATAFVAGGTAGKLAQIRAPGEEGSRPARRS